MKERPILFTPPMVRAILKERKTQTRRVGEAVELHLSGVRYVRNVHGDWLNAVYPELPVHPATREALDKIARLTAEVERLKWEAVVWKSSLECWGRHHPWCWMVTQAGVEGVYCNCGYREALTGKDRSHEVTPLSPHDAEQVRLFEERIRASITPETQEAARRFIEARDAFAASGDSLPTHAPEATETKCPDCGGHGFYVADVTTNECCGHGTPSGECCGSPVAGVEQEQVACERCQATGKAAPPAPEAQR